jgi:agmatinase
MDAGRPGPPITVPPERGFLGLDDADAVGYEAARAVVVPFGLEASVSYGAGTSKGPAAILEASKQVELFDEELWREPFRSWGVVTLADPIASEAELSVSLNQISAIAEALVSDGKFPLVLGGEHSITAGAIRPHLRNGEKLLVLQFDAHADLRDGYEGEHWSHASAMRRVLDAPNVELLSFGMRNISAEEAQFYGENRDRISIHWARDRNDWDLDSISRSFASRSIYLTVDVDGFDSSLMPSTGTPEPGGLFWDDVLPIIRSAAANGTIVGADICELAPMLGNHAPNFLAAKLAYKILCYALD